MKKVIALLVALCVVVAFSFVVGCKPKAEEPKAPAAPAEQPAAPAEPTKEAPAPEKAPTPAKPAPAKPAKK
jgi:hypothetical protein